jgi:adenylate cyclase
MADIADYTNLVERDVNGTVTAWTAARVEVIDPKVAKYSGRIVKLTGDGFLTQFATVQDAVECTIAIQERLVESILDFRIGVSLGDVVDDGEDLHGESVNIAARIESLAEPGCVSISGTVFENFATEST